MVVHTDLSPPISRDTLLLTGLWDYPSLTNELVVYPLQDIGINSSDRDIRLVVIFLAN